jgi:hypothetical protein
MRYFEFLNCPLETFSGTGANRFLKGLLRLLPPHSILLQLPCPHFHASNNIYCNIHEYAQAITKRNTQHWHYIHNTNTLTKCNKTNLHPPPSVFFSFLGVFLFQNLPQKARKNKQGFPGPLTTSAYTLVFLCNAEEHETERRQRLRVPV